MHVETSSQRHDTGSLATALFNPVGITSEFTEKPRKVEPNAFSDCVYPGKYIAYEVMHY